MPSQVDLHALRVKRASEVEWHVLRVKRASGSDWALFMVEKIIMGAQSVSLARFTRNLLIK